MPPPRSDEDGEIRSTLCLYKSYGPVIYARCKRLLRDEEAARDATQEVFIRVMRHLAKTPPGDEALRWISRIATNYCLNQIRDRQRLVSLEDLEAGLQPRVEPICELASRDLARTLIFSLPEHLRAVAWLCYVDELPGQEVAKNLGISRRTVVYRLAEVARTFAAVADS